MAFKKPLTDIYFEDYVVGDIHEFGTIDVTENEIIAFAESYDPQPFHTDRLAAEKSVYGGIIASGWHTAGLTMRLLVDHFIAARAGMGSPGIDELRWLLPVRPGDELSVKVTIIEARRSASKPDRGIVKYLAETTNQKQKTVMSFSAISIIGCAPA